MGIRNWLITPEQVVSELNHSMTKYSYPLMFISSDEIHTSLNVVVLPQIKFCFVLSGTAVAELYLPGYHLFTITTECRFRGHHHNCILK